jgi:hypothetical protein
VQDGKATVFDVRPLRAFLTVRAQQAAWRGLHELCRGYDAVLVFPEFHAATELVPSPR